LRPVVLRQDGLAHLLHPGLVCRAQARTVTKKARYGHDHRGLRTRVAREVATGAVRCCRCGDPIRPGEPWDLDHADDGPGYRGAAHRSCNRSAGALRLPGRHFPILSRRTSCACGLGIGAGRRTSVSAGSGTRSCLRGRRRPRRRLGERLDHDLLNAICLSGTRGGEADGSLPSRPRVLPRQGCG
jgi:hypothetical protein